MNVRKSLLFAVPAFLLFAVGNLPSQAQNMAVQHPAYMHALSDLRQMRGYLDRLTPSERIDDDSARAVQEVDAAINTIKQASIDDHRDLREHPPIDAHITPTDRFHKAREAGNAAWHDLDHEEDNGFANGLKHRAMDHIEKANHIVDDIINHYEHGQHIQ